MTTAARLDDPRVLLPRPRAFALRLVHAAALPFTLARGRARRRAEAHARAEERDYARSLIATYGKLD